MNEVNKSGPQNDRSYLESNLPQFVCDAIDALNRANETDDPLWGSYYGDMHGALNGAYYDELITKAQYDYLWDKYIRGII